ncbi:hypothetical protein INS49_006324 [Diaporthe citri]|uniref:uncharacterized protein n=1 Tax=Diaporthe citri TaxID=83186 RepID=UPI001C80EB87|nr:uncharacterized protein INS49_006324 [Diaporthe citri]KAG6364720.1 hypothetical protein INS49_006324 [Diaporthe citri]
MESTDLESPIHLLRHLRWAACLTATCTGIFRERRRLARPREYEELDEALDILNQCGGYLGKITNLVEELVLGGRGFPVNLRMEICDQLGPYNDFWSSDMFREDYAASTMDTLQKIYDDLSLQAASGVGFNYSEASFTRNQQKPAYSSV